ncbi:gliding motility protein GldM [Chitinophaga sp. XS-30]|uniref:type IX secretion system motor protein PorM/GldM n=1 Tax=Chitinophaga sp. XS-30 TaxID=2604421 RepID=UPI0011DCE7BF|nr:gliding motility protein GldM [Chitinophaga sp. XS-30]QEH40318.1 gliding motility protein GldM [Chitinophaga sp. XS-30]
MALPKDPRQKMINFMYLVLTAMLALNVSAEIINAFDIVNDSIKTSNNSIDSKNSITYNQFAKLMSTDAAKVGPLKTKADQVKKLSAAAVTYIDSLKSQIIAASGGLNENGEIKKKDHLDAATHVMENEKKGPELQAELKKLRSSMLALVNPKDRDAMAAQLPLQVEEPPVKKGSVKKNWTTYHFNMVPTIAAVTILGKFQNDIKNSESMIIDKLLKEVSEDDFVFDQLDAFVSLNSKNFTAGQTLTATVVMGAYSSTVNPTIVVNGSPVPATAGKGVYSLEIGNALGEHTISGTVQLTKPNGEVINRPFTETYNVGASATSISADKMNVLYIALQNPISISAAGVPAEKIQASISSGSLTKTGPGRYLATVSSGTKATISISAEVDGKMKDLGAKEFRIKNIPDPIMKVGFNKGPGMKAAEFKAQGGLRADLEDFLFEGVKYAVVGYRMGIEPKGRDYIEGDATSEYWPKNLTGAIQSIKPGDNVYFDNIKVKGPDGRVRSMQNINFKIN